MWLAGLNQGAFSICAESYTSALLIPSVVHRRCMNHACHTCGSPKRPVYGLQLDLKNDAYYGMFECIDGMFRFIEDASQLSKVLAKWAQESPAGPKRLYFKRAIYIPKSPTDLEELASTSQGKGPHYLSFIDAAYHFVHGMYRFDAAVVAKTAAMLLASYRGPFTRARDTVEVLSKVVPDLVPLFCLKGPGAPSSSPATCAHRGHGVGVAASAVTVDEMTAKVIEAYKALGTLSLLQAQKMLVKACKASRWRWSGSGAVVNESL